MKCGLCGDWPAARRDRERVGRRGAAFRDETGQEAHPGDRSNGSPPTFPREKELGGVREDPLPALPLSLCAAFSPPVLVRKPLPSHKYAKARALPTPAFPRSFRLCFRLGGAAAQHTKEETAGLATPATAFQEVLPHLPE